MSTYQLSYYNLKDNSKNQESLVEAPTALGAVCKTFPQRTPMRAVGCDHMTKDCCHIQFDREGLEGVKASLHVAQSSAA